MSFRYRQPLKCKYPESDMLCLQVSTPESYGKGRCGGCSLGYAWSRKTKNLSNSRAAQTRGGTQAGPGPFIFTHLHLSTSLPPKLIMRVVFGWKGSSLTIPALPTAPSPPLKVELFVDK